MPSVDTVSFRWLSSTEGLDVAILPAPVFPLPGGVKHPICSVVESIRGAMQRKTRAEIEVFFQMTTLHIGGNVLVSANAKEWWPEYMMGVRPGNPPRMLRHEEVAEIDPTGPFPYTFHPVFHVTRAEGRTHCVGVLSGFATLVTLVTHTKFDDFIEEMEKQFLDKIEEPLFRSVPKYLPLIDAPSAIAAGPALVEQWLAGAHLYIRESFDEKGIVIISREPLQPILDELQARPDKDDRELVHIPAIA